MADGICAIFGRRVFEGGSLKRGEAGKLEEMIISLENLTDLFFWANKIRIKHRGNKVHLCSIVNAKSGSCSEDCRFCSQSSFNNTNIDEYSFIGKDKISSAYGNALKNKADGFSIVISGRGATDREISEIGELAESNGNGRMYWCASLGELTREQLRKLKKSGLKKIHHNLETSRNYFPNICSTHNYDDKIATVKAAIEEGMEVCCGGIFGLGESWADRIDMAFELKELGVSSVPLNFLNPIPGTPLEKRNDLTPADALKIIALYRLILPEKSITICGGREVNLRDLQSQIFYAGASGMMIGGYLTTGGREVKKDLQMLKDLGLDKGGY